MRIGGNVRVLGLVLAAAVIVPACGDGTVEPSVTPTTPSTDGGREADAAPLASLCPEGKAVEWPPGPYGFDLTSVVPPDLTFEGTDGVVRLKDYFEPCALRSRVIVVRSMAAWCGPCGWHATNTKKLFDDPRITDRFVLIDLLLADEDNMPPSAAAAARWRGRMDAPGKVAVDPKYTFGPTVVAFGPLPSYALLDSRTMRVINSITDPDPELLQSKVYVELAVLEGKPLPNEKSVALYDDLISLKNWELLQATKLVAEPPKDPTNEYADVPAAATLGKALFSDKLLSPSGTVACATCHDATKGFADATPQSTGVSLGDRNSPAAALAAHARWQFWDGRADTLWMQALGPFENPKEFASSRLYVVHQIASRYAVEYEAVFGAKYPLPDFSDAARFPASGKPGDPSWQTMTQADRDAVTRVYVNAGKAIAAFERTIRVKPNALDRYAGGDKTALTAAQKKALEQFFTVGCAQCHWGPRFTDDAFHDVGFDTGRGDGAADRGRLDVLAGLASSELVATTKWSDSPAAAKLLVLPAAPSMLGAFKTPPLRGVAGTGPFGHGGSFATLLDITKHYGTRGKSTPGAKTAGVIEPWLPEFDANVQKELPAILETMTAEPEP